MPYFLLIALSFVSLQVQATIRLDNLEQAQLTYAKESISSENDFTVQSASTDLNLASELGFAFPNKTFYARFDLTGATFTGTVGMSSSSAFTSNLVRGGALGESFAVFSLIGSGSNQVTSLATLALNAIKVSDLTVPVVASFKLYDNATDAINQSNTFVSRRAKQIITFEHAIVPSFTTNHRVVSDIGTSFTQFLPSFRSPSSFSLGDSTRILASLGKFTPLVQTNALLDVDTSQAITSFSDLLPNIMPAQSPIELSGDTNAAKMFLSANDDCSTQDVSDFENLMLQNIIDYPVLCAGIKISGKLQQAEFTLDIGLGLEPQLLGEIRYNAAQLDLPFLTRFQGHRQKIFVTNHSSRVVKYHTELSTEESVNDVSLLSLADGEIGPKETLKLDSTDIFEVNSGSINRVSARIYLDAKKEDISAAVQLVSLESNAPPVTNVLTINER